jgi:hypothetical protein
MNHRESMFQKHLSNFTYYKAKRPVNEVYSKFIFDILKYVEIFLNVLGIAKYSKHAYHKT